MALRDAIKLTAGSQCNCILIRSLPRSGARSCSPFHSLILGTFQKISNFKTSFILLGQSHPPCAAILAANMSQMGMPVAFTLLEGPTKALVKSAFTAAGLGSTTLLTFSPNTALCITYRQAYDDDVFKVYIVFI